jgi:hypothetical protein
MVFGFIPEYGSDSLRNMRSASPESSKLARPIEYQHPSGAVIWVRLESAGGKKDHGGNYQEVAFDFVAAVMQRVG